MHERNFKNIGFKNEQSSAFKIFQSQSIFTNKLSQYNHSSIYSSKNQVLNEMNQNFNYSEKKIEKNI